MKIQKVVPAALIHSEKQLRQLIMTGLIQSKKSRIFYKPELLNQPKRLDLQTALEYLQKLNLLRSRNRGIKKLSIQISTEEKFNHIKFFERLFDCIYRHRVRNIQIRIDSGFIQTLSQSMKTKIARYLRGFELVLDASVQQKIDAQDTSHLISFLNRLTGLKILKMCVVSSSMFRFLYKPKNVPITNEAEILAKLTQKNFKPWMLAKLRVFGYSNNTQIGKNSITKVIDMAIPKLYSKLEKLSLNDIQIILSPRVIEHIANLKGLKFLEIPSRNFVQIASAEKEAPLNTICNSVRVLNIIDAQPKEFLNSSLGKMKHLEELYINYHKKNYKEASFMKLFGCICQLSELKKLKIQLFPAVVQYKQDFINLIQQKLGNLRNLKNFDFADQNDCKFSLIVPRLQVLKNFSQLQKVNLFFKEFIQTSDQSKALTDFISSARDLTHFKLEAIFRVDPIYLESLPEALSQLTKMVQLQLIIRKSKLSPKFLEKLSESVNQKMRFISKLILNVEDTEGYSAQDLLGFLDSFAVPKRIRKLEAMLGNVLAQMNGQVAQDQVKAHADYDDLLEEKIVKLRKYVPRVDIKTFKLQ